MATKKQLTIQQRDWLNHLGRLKRGFINRWHERHEEHPRRKYNCRKLTIGRIKYRRETDL